MADESERPFPPGDYPVVVVGSGPGGLQVSYFLSRLGIRHAVLSADDRPAGMFLHWPFFQRLLSWTKPYAPADRHSREYERWDWNSLLANEPELRGLQAEFMDGSSDFPSRQEMEANLAAFAERAGIAIRYGCTWESTRREETAEGDRFVLVTSDGEYRCVRTADGTEYRCWAVLLALGSTYRRLGIPGEEDFVGAGVHFCATCDGAFYRDKDVLVVGGGNSAGEESIFLTKFAKRVTIATRDADLTASSIVAQKVREHPQIEVITNVSPAEFRGDKRLETVVLKDRQSGETREIHPSGVFVFIGLTPNAEIVKELVETDEQGFIVTDASLQTSVPGLFAAGDVRAGSTKQAASAAGEGAAVALGIRRYLQERASGMPRREETRAA